MNIIKIYPSLRSVEGDGYNHGAVYLRYTTNKKPYKNCFWKYADEIKDRKSM